MFVDLEVGKAGRQRQVTDRPALRREPPVGLDRIESRVAGNAVVICRGSMTVRDR